MKRAVFIAYLLAVHVALGLAVWKSRHRANFGQTMQAIYRVTDATVPDGSAIFLGDSITQRLAVPGVNMAISGQSTADLARRIPEYHSLRRASVLYLLIGANDLRLQREPDYAALLATLPDVPLVWSGVMPSRYYDPTATNRRIQALCAARPKCRYVDTSAMVPSDFIDGLHPNANGYRKWAAQMPHAAISAARAVEKSGWSNTLPAKK